MPEKPSAAAGLPAALSGQGAPAARPSEIDVGRPGEFPVPEGPSALSDREVEVLKLLATGATNQQIAHTLIISPNTVKVHLRKIYEKLGVQSRTEASMEAVRRGWVPVINGVAAGELAANGTEQPSEGAVGVRGVAMPAPARRPPIATWQRIYMIVAAVLVTVAALAPTWRESRSSAQSLTAIGDGGQPQMAPAPRPKVVRWMARAALPEARSRLAAAMVGSKLYAVAGETAAGVTADVAVYDPASNGWLPVASKPTAVANVSAAVLDGLIYVPGGTVASGESSQSVEVYDPAADAWSTRAALPVPLAGYALVGHERRLYLYGGWDGVNYRSDTLIYDPTSDTWSTGRPMAAPRAFLAAAELDGLIYVVGGYDGQRELDEVAVYDPKAEDGPDGPWSTRSSLDQPRGGLAVVMAGQRLYALGGGWTRPIGFNEQYDVHAGAWSHIETPVAGQWRGVAVAAAGDDIYAVGGWSDGYLSVNERYQAGVRIFVPFSSSGD